MLHWQAVRVGFVNTVLWERYGPFWADLLRAAGAEVVVPSGDDVIAAAADVPADEGWMPLLARASLRALRDVDLVLVPRLAPEDQQGPGAAQDPWVMDVGAMLARSEPGRATVRAVPADLGPGVEAVAIPLLTRIVGEVGRVRRVWEQFRVAAQQPWRPRQRAVAAGGDRFVAVAGAPWWCTPSVAAALARPGERIGGQHEVAPAELRAEARRWRADLVDPDAEALGAVRRFARRGDVQAVRLVIDPARAADAWLARRARELAGTRVEPVALDEVVALAELVRMLVPGRSAGAAAGTAAEDPAEDPAEALDEAASEAVSNGAPESGSEPQA